MTFTVSLVPSLAPVMHDGRQNRGATIAGNLRGGRALKARATVSGAAVIVAVFASGCGAGGEVTTVTPLDAHSGRGHRRQATERGITREPHLGGRRTV